METHSVTNRAPLSTDAIRVTRARTYSAVCHAIVVYPEVSDEGAHALIPSPVACREATLPQKYIPELRKAASDAGIDWDKFQVPTAVAHHLTWERQWGSCMLLWVGPQ